MLLVRIGIFAICLFFLSFQSTAQVDLANGLVAFYPFNGNAADASGNSNNGVPTNGAQLTTDRFGLANSAYQFDGIDDYIEIADNPALNQARNMSIALYFYPTKTGTQTLIGKIAFTGGIATQFQIAFDFPTYPGVLFGVNPISNGCSGVPLNGSYVNTGGSFPLNRWYCIVATIENGVQKIYLDGVLMQTANAGFLDLNQCSNAQMRIGYWWQGDQQPFRGKIDDIRIYNRALNQQEVSSLCSVACVINEDFTTERNPCNANLVNLKTTSSSHTSIRWILGDGTIIDNQNSVTHNYAAFGNYEVKMILNTPTCTDTIIKMVQVDVVKENIVLTPDTTICAGTTKTLRSLPGLKSCWSPIAYLDNPNSPNPVTNTPVSMTYYLTSESTGANLIKNGDFSAGNVDFTSAYSYAPNNVTEGEYFVGPSPVAWNAALSSCTDHTNSGNRNMMLVNGSPVANVEVWRQTITVTPNTNYAFSTWIQALWPPNPAQLSFSINGKDIGNLITATIPTCNWSQFYATWNSGSATTATISIVNKNTLIQGNDFALDDISFAPVFLKQDSVKISVENASVKTVNDTTVCAGSTIPLTTTGALNYTWAPSTNLSSSTIASPIATVSSSVRYIVTGTTVNGCVAKDTVDLGMFLKPTINITNDTAVCKGTPVQLSATGGSSYQWSPAGSLNDPTISNPIATPLTTTLYKVIITDPNTCSYEDSVRVEFKSLGEFAASPDASVCEGTSVKLSARGGNLYSWSPALYLDNPSSATPIAQIQNSIQYSVAITDTVCAADTVIIVNLVMRPSPNVAIIKQNDIDCTNPTTPLRAQGAATYTWSPAEAVDNPKIFNPIVAIDTTTLLKVTGTDQFGCSSSDSVIVTVSKAGLPTFVLPNAFTPNNDGRNDCFGIKRWGNVTISEMSIYNRWGQKVFTTKSPSQCWDGYFNGQLQMPGAYVYIIKARGFCGEIERKGIVMLIR